MKCIKRPLVARGKHTASLDQKCHVRLFVAGIIVGRNAHGKRAYICHDYLLQFLRTLLDSRTEPDAQRHHLICILTDRRAAPKQFLQKILKHGKLCRAADQHYFINFLCTLTLLHRTYNHISDPFKNRFAQLPKKRVVQRQTITIRALIKHNRRFGALPAL